MFQGDSYSLGIRVLNNAGNPVTPTDIRDLEITIGGLTKSYRGAQLSYHDGLWLFPVSQRETLSVYPGPLRAQVRVAWANGVIEGKSLHGMRMDESISKEVL